MRLTVNQYAKALYGSAKNKSEKEIEEIISNFLKLLQKNKQIKLAEKIIEKFRMIWNEENDILEVEVVSREELSEKDLERIERFVIEKYKTKEVVLHKKNDKNVKGGIILRIGDEMIDGSVSSMIKNLKNELIK